jgi:hypothetical protein
MSKHFKQDKKVLKQSADWTSYGDLTIEKESADCFKTFLSCLKCLLMTSTLCFLLFIL